MTNTTEITTQLWSMANSLRGTMDASEYKNYILPFMFYRYLSERQEQYLNDNGLEEFYEITEEDEINDYIADLNDSLGYAITPDYTWDKIVEKIESHQIKASDFQDMFDSFYNNVTNNGESESDFANVFSDVNLGDTRLGSSTNDRAKALNDIVMMINEFKFKDEEGHDILGDVYEYLIGQFAANAGKKGGEFYTPHQVSQILARIVTLDKEVDDEQFHVFDPTMGSGSLLLTVQKELKNGEKEGAVDFYGQELNTTTFNLARMNLMMHGVNYRNMHLRRADTLDSDWPSEDRDGTMLPLHFDAVVANPPYSQKWDTKSVKREDDVRFSGYGVAPASKADFAFVLHGLYHLKSSGTMAIVLPHGVLFRGAAEEKIRKKLIENNLLDAVIGLPANLFYGTSIPTCVLVFKGHEARGKNKDILFIDASKEFEKGKNQNKLSEENLEKIVSTYQNREEIEKYSHVASIEEIQDNDFNLNIPRYVDTFEEEPEIPLSEVAKDLELVRSNIAESTEKLLGLLGELKGTTPEADKELQEFLKLFK